MKITIPYQPRSWARKLHDTTKRWVVLVLHRRAGKTVACLNHLQRDALRTANSKYGYIAPTYRQAKDVAWDMIKHYARPVPGVEFNEAELRVDYPNGSRIRLYGADNPDALRGIALWGVVFDEYSQQPSNIFTEIIRPALADHKGYAIWIGTPKGKNDFYRLYEYGKTDVNWLSLLLTVNETNVLDTDELADARKMMSEDEYSQEFLCSFETAVKGAVYGKEWAELIQAGRLQRIEYDPNLPTYSAWDFGIGDATAVGIYQVPPLGKEVRLIDYYENTDQILQHYIEWLKNKPYKLSMSYGDPAGKQRNLLTGRSVFEDLNSAKTTQYLGYPLSMFSRPSHVIDKIHSTKKLLQILWVDERCKAFINAITNYHYQWDEAKGEYKPDPYHDWSSHAMDQLGYFSVNYLVPPVKDPIQERINKLQAKDFDLSTNFYSNTYE